MGRQICWTIPFLHAKSHLQRMLYSCHHCSKQFSAITGVTGHLKSKHKLPRGLGHFDDHSDNYHEEILDILKQCYEQNESKWKLIKIRKYYYCLFFLSSYSSKIDFNFNYLTEKNVSNISFSPVTLFFYLTWTNSKRFKPFLFVFFFEYF